MSPYEELCRAFKLKIQPGEDFEGFAVRAADRVNKCSDAQWKELSEELQVWTNETQKVIENNLKDDAEKADFPELTGYPAEADAEEASAIDDGEVEMDDAERIGDEGVEDSSEEGQDAESADDPGESGEEVKPVTRRKPGTTPAKSKSKPTGKGKAMVHAATATNGKTAPPPPKAAAARKAPKVAGELDKKSKIIHDAVARAKGATAVEVQALLKRNSPPDMKGRLERIGVKYKIDGERDGHKVYKVA